MMNAHCLFSDTDGERTYVNYAKLVHYFLAAESLTDIKMQQRVLQTLKCRRLSCRH